MEKKLKISEFAELIGVTAKTAYKMESRGEITTVSEKVNNRLTTLVITNDDQIKQFRSIYSKSPFGNGNCEDMLTDNYETLNNHDSSQSANNNELIQDMFERIITINDEYNNRIAKLNEELVNSKSRMMLLEDKAGREGLYIKEINELKTENNRLKTDKTKVANQLTMVVVVLLMVVVGLVTYNVAIVTKNEQTEQEIANPAPVEVVTTNKTVKTTRKK